MDGHKIHCFEGHVAPVCSILPRSKENIQVKYFLSLPLHIVDVVYLIDIKFLQYLFSTSADGKVRAWIYDDKNFHLEYDAPGKCSTTLIYSADGTR